MNKQSLNSDISGMSRLLDSIRGKPYCQAMSLPASFYTDQDWLEREQKFLFAEDWFCVGRQELLEHNGDYVALEVSGEPIVILKGLDGKIRALSNVCRHRGTVIMQGKGNTKSLLCPYHHWAYDTEGALVNAPEMSQQPGFDSSQCRLPEFKVTIWIGFIFVCFNDAAAPFHSKLEGLLPIIANYHLEQMRELYSAEEVWDINWKCLLENYMEGYHLSPLHRKTLHQYNPSNLCEHIQPGSGYFGYQVGFSARVSALHKGHRDLTGDQKNHCVMFAIPPGFAVGIGSDYSSYICLYPISAQQVRVKMGLIFYGDDWPENEVQDAIILFQKTMEEDKTILLRLQQGLNSRFHTPGKLAPSHLEGTVWDFYQYLANKMGGR